jgi:hypothetical protein
MFKLGGQCYIGMRFATNLVSNGYCDGVNMWLTLSIRMSFSTCTCQLLGNTWPSHGYLCNYYASSGL